MNAYRECQFAIVDWLREAIGEQGTQTYFVIGQTIFGTQCHCRCQIGLSRLEVGPIGSEADHVPVEDFAATHHLGKTQHIIGILISVEIQGAGVGMRHLSRALGPLDEAHIVYRRRDRKVISHIIGQAQIKGNAKS